MNADKSAPSSKATKKKTVTIERTFEATLDDVWELWTTKDGIESWWGPDGFGVTVSKLELKVGGELHYTMNALAPEMVAFMKKENMPTSTACHLVFTDITPKTKLAYLHNTDFVPGVTAYNVEHVVTMRADKNKVHMTLVVDAMHDEEWTKRMSMGWENEFDKLAARLKARRAV